jgi:hypothetical protein
VAVPRRVACAAAVVTAVIAAAGCGGGTASPQEAWAGDVCSSFADWKTEIDSVRRDVETELKAPSPATPSHLQSAAERVDLATRKLASELKGTGAPPGENGAKVQDVVSGFADSLRLTVSTIQTQVEKVEGSSSGPTAAIDAIGAIGSQVAGAAAQGREAINQIGQLSSDLKTAFDDADECEPFRND